MDFFKSLVSDEPDPSQPQSPNGSQPASPSVDQDDVDQYSDGGGGGGGGLWSFGGLIQSIASRSESVIETYRRDLQEFGTGLKKETEMFREAASKAVKDLPASIDVAHGVIKSTAEIILAAADEDQGSGETNPRDSVRYNRFEAQLTLLQSDVRTFLEEPDDLEDFGRWKLGFALIDKGEEIEDLIGGSGVLGGLFKRLVPSQLDNETFWFRYFYRVHKLQQQESLRANLVRRAISIDDDEELSWDVDDDDDDSEDDEEDDDDSDGIDDHGNAGGTTSIVKDKGDKLAKKEKDGGLKKKEKGDELAKEVKDGELENREKGDELDNKEDSSDWDSKGIEKEGNRKDESFNVSGDNVGESKSNVESASKKNDVELKSRGESELKKDEKLVRMENSEVTKGERVEDSNKKVEKPEAKVEKSEEKVSLGGKGDKGGGLGKETGASVESSKKSIVEEEDLEWDEIEDVDSNDEKKPSASIEKSGQADLRKRLSTAEDDEDLSWDIEDDDD